MGGGLEVGKAPGGGFGGGGGEDVGIRVGELGECEVEGADVGVFFCFCEVSFYGLFVSGEGESYDGMGRDGVGGLTVELPSRVERLGLV